MILDAEPYSNSRPIRAVAGQAGYAFQYNGEDGNNPGGFLTLVRDNAGNLYGTTAAGGACPCKGGCGAVFELKP